MTIGNVTDYVQMVAQIGNMQTDLLNATQTGKTSNDGFANVMNRFQNNTTEFTNKVTTSENPGSNREEAYRKESGVKEIVTKTETKTVSSDDHDKVSGEIKDAIKNALSIDDEQLEESMAALGLTVADLLVPTNVVSLVAYVNDVTPGEIVTNEDISRQLTNALESIDTVIETFAAENQIPVEVLLDQLMAEPETEPLHPEHATESANVEETVSEAMEQTVVLDTESGKQITITVEHNVVTSEEVTFTEAPRTEQPAQDYSEKDGSEEGKQEHNLAQQLVQNITNAVTENVSELTPEFSSFTNVNATDVIQQMIDAVKVNVTSQIQSMEIQLNPESLGKINLTVVAKDGMITASIAAQNEAVKNALETQMVALKENLNNAGIKVENVEVTVAGRSFDSNMNQQNQNNDADHKSNARRRFRGIDEIGLDDEVLDLRNEVTQDGNINVTA